ncbi:hypothetical protein BY458DRAFT_498813 [Sporodiniella umbellata]|nr:hypothetical protein BY458DRAFT_498813 [Sporodiniella umbellata]
MDQKNILETYFKIKITSDGQIEALPMLTKNYVPSLEKLPFLMYNIATQINWKLEIDCLEEISREISMFYCVSNKVQWEQTAELLHQKKIRVPSYIGHSGYLIELDIPSCFFKYK